MKNSAPQTRVIEQRLTEIGLQHEEQREDAVQRDRELDAGYVAALLALVEQPGGEHDEGRLDEFGGLDARRSRIAASAWRP